MQTLQYPAIATAERDPAMIDCVAVIYATRGRPETLVQVVEYLQRQTLQPSSIIVSCPSLEDAGVLIDAAGVDVVLGPAGLAAQRNTALRHLGDGIGTVVFFDDDFVADAGWVASAVRTFVENPTVGAVTGTLIADDIKGPGLSFDTAVALVAAGVPPARPTINERAVPYGCNMAFRRSAIEGLTFDERLIRYGWLEDRDFGAAMVRGGYRSVKISGSRGVHMGVKRSRVPGRMLGYSQVVNPLYMRAKGTMSTVEVFRHITRNLASNIVGSLASEPFIDRRGRLNGNLAGFLDVLRGRLDPERAERA